MECNLLNDPLGLVEGSLTLVLAQLMNEHDG